MYKMYSHEFAKKYLSEPEALRYLSNIRKGSIVEEIERTEKRGCKFNSLSAYIINAFNCVATPEKHIYWNNIINRINNIR